jgi:hypothetical protein
VAKPSLWEKQKKRESFGFAYLPPFQDFSLFMAILLFAFAFVMIYLFLNFASAIGL